MLRIILIFDTNYTNFHNIIRILSKDKGKPIFNIHLIILKKDINNPSLKNNLHTLYEVNKCV